MAQWLKVYGDTEGPLGFPMFDKEAKVLDELLKTLPEQDYQKVVVEKAMTELSPGERADVSWICTEAIDRQREVVLTAGFRDEQYKSNPIVTLNHDYTREPVGRSLWRKRVRDGQTHGVKAKTLYPPRPADWKGDIWAPDQAFHLVETGLMRGKSIGFLTVKAHSPTEEEVRTRPEWKGVTRIIDEWILLEYCCTWLPVNPEAITEAISKSLVRPAALAWVGADLPNALPDVLPYTTLDEIEKAIGRATAQIDVKAMVDRLLADSLAKARGRI